jgi:hypothetical protein
MEPTTLEYGSRDTLEPRRPPGVVAVIACAVLTVVAASTCVRIEWLNAQAGYYLPRAAFDTGPWPTVPGSDEAYRLYNASSDRELASRPLSPEERRAVRGWAAQNALRDVVRTWGLAQYAVVPALLAISGRMLWRRPTLGALALAAACCGIAVACGWSMLYRGYLGSLGLR